MTYRELEEMAAGLKDAQVNAQLAELGRDPRFAAVVSWLERNARAWAGTVSSQGLAEKHGKLAHAAGSLHAVQVLQGQLAGILAPKAKREERPSEE